MTVAAKTQKCRRRKLKFKKEAKEVNPSVPIAEPRMRKCHLVRQKFKPLFLDDRGLMPTAHCSSIGSDITGDGPMDPIVP